MQSENRIRRPRETWARLGVGRSNFHENYVHKNGGPEHIPGTTIPRLRPIVLGPRARGFLDDEIDALIEALRRHRDGGAASAATRVVAPARTTGLSSGSSRRRGA